MSGLLNLFVGFLALFPGLFEVGLSQSQLDNSQTNIFIALLTTSYGLYAISHLLGSTVQIFGGSYIWVIAGKSKSLIHSLIVFAVVSLGLEVWDWLYKGYVTFFAVPGIVAGAFCAYLYYAAIQHRAAA